MRHVDRGRKENMLKPNFTVDSQKKEERKNHENLYSTLMKVKEEEEEKENDQIDSFKKPKFKREKFKD